MYDPCPVAVKEAKERFMSLIGQGLTRLEALEHARLEYGVPAGSILAEIRVEAEERVNRSSAYLIQAQHGARILAS